MLDFDFFFCKACWRNLSSR